jgi:multidrug efflux system membrane fusion protein
MKRLAVSKSVLMAAGLLVAVVAWMVSGVGRESLRGPEQSAGARVAAATLPRVTVQDSRAQSITREIVVSARTEPNRRVELRAETDGRVVAVGAERGRAVKAGERVVGLDLRDRQARLDEARALIAYADLQFEAARKLQTQQFVSDTQMADLLSRVVGARAALQLIELEVANTSIVAPFDALLQERLVEVGDYVNSGDSVAQLVDTDPLIVVGDVSEREIHDLAVGVTGTARLVNREPIEGRIRYLSPIAAESTRTFRVELAIPNPEGALRAGMTAEMRLNADRISAHRISAALLTLDEAGAIGVKSVNGYKRVEFHEIEIVGSSADGVSVTGLPEDIRLIVVGQGYVRPGDLVEPVLATPSARVSDISRENESDGTQAKR